MTTRGSISENDDLDSYISAGGMYYCSQLYSSTILNSPWKSQSFALFVKGGLNPNATSGQAQFAISEIGFACRYYWASKWSSWTYFTTSLDFSVLESEVLRYRGTVSSSVEGPDALTQIGSYYIASARSKTWYQTYDWPTDMISRLTVFGGAGSSSAALTQLLSSGGKLWVRLSTGAGDWGSWKQFSYLDDIKFADTSFSFGLFENFAVLGGSYDCGYSYSSTGSGVTNYNRSWGTLLAKDSGNIAHIYAAPGTSIPEWYDPNYSHADRCVSMFLSDEPSNLYITTFAANDDEPLGSISDCENYDPSVTPTTYYGWYAKLIHDIREKAPNALILMTTPSSEGIINSWTTKIAAIREIAAYYQIPVIRWMDDKILSENLITYTSATSSNHPHPTPIGHSMLASAWTRLFDRCVYENSEYFNSYR